MSGRWSPRPIKRGEYIQHFETVRLRKDGVRVEVSLTISPASQVLQLPRTPSPSRWRSIALRSRLLSSAHAAGPSWPTIAWLQRITVFVTRPR